MIDRPMHKGLRWFYCVVGMGCLISTGIYIHKAASGLSSTASLLRALMFLLIGIFLMLRYGESKVSS